MKNLLLFCTLLVFFGCSYPSYVLKGDYSKSSGPFVAESKQDVVWEKIIDLFSSRGFAIKIIDKSSGLITSEPVSFLGLHTREGADFKPVDKGAYVVIGDFRNIWGAAMHPQLMTGDWNIRIKDTGGKTSITVNLVNLKCTYTTTATAYERSTIIDIPIKSTGVFEKEIAELIK